MTYIPGIVIKKNGETIVSNPDAIDFITDGTVTESPTGTARVDLNAAIRGGLFGDGSDGDVTDPSDLTRDMYYDDLTITANATLNTNNYRIFVKGTLTLNGVIRCIGGNASGDVPGVAVAAGSLPTLGSPNDGVTYGLGSVGEAGPNGGAGGNGDLYPGDPGTAGNAAPGFTALANAYKGVRNLFSAIDGRTPISNDYIQFKGHGTPGSPTGANDNNSGNGGTGGQGNSGTEGAGGNAGRAGANGGFIVICCKTLAGSGTISVVGGNGTNGSNGTAGTGTSGGGGGGAGGNGGNGGIIVLAYGADNSSVTRTVSGGNAGTGGSGGAGYAAAVAGGDGVDGAEGILMEFDLG